jgi:radical SAM-linked protein
MRVRVRFAKQGKVRFTGHRDVARIWDRTLRKAQIPVALTEGFSPRPRISFGLALPTGAESIAEYLDVEVTKGHLVELDGLADRLTECLPPGFSVMQVAECSPGTPSLQESVVATGWELTLMGDSDSQRWVDEVREGVARVLAADELRLHRERKGERTEDDVRPSIETLEVSVGLGVVLRAVLTTGGRALRPHELVAVTLPGRDPLDSVARVLRTHQWIEQEGARHELLPAAPAPVGART